MSRQEGQRHLMILIHQTQQQLSPQRIRLLILIYRLNLHFLQGKR